MRTVPRLLTVAIATSFSVVALAQDAALQAQNKLLAKRAAEADAYRKLAESVYGVKITSDTFVRDFVTESDQIKAAVDTFIKGVRLGEARYYDDGVAEIDAEVTVAQLVTKLKEVHTQHYHGRSITTTDIENIQQRMQTDVIKVTGSGAPRPELPPDLPAGVEDVITPLPPAYAPPPTLSVPPIWKTVGPQARLLAERAAYSDAMRKLLEQIKGVRINSDTLVKDFITESDEISAQAQGIVVGAREVGKYLHTDDLIVEVTMEVPVEKVITKIKELHTEHYHGNRITTTDVTNIKKQLQRDYIRATGSGVPRPQFIQQAQAQGHQMPGWMADTIEATGQGTDASIDTAQGKLKAARAAEMDAMRKLAEQVYGLEISSSTTVKDFVTQNDQISTEVEGVISGAIVGTPTFADGVATITVSLPAAEVWSVVNDQMQVLQRHKQG
jgi:hypothetical protein